MVLQVISPVKQIYQGEVDLVQMPGQMGSFEILQNHAPLVALLEAGKVKVIDSERNMFFIEINGGLVKVKDNHITILTSAPEA